MEQSGSTRFIYHVPTREGPTARRDRVVGSTGVLSL